MLKDLANPGKFEEVRRRLILIAGFKYRIRECDAEDIAQQALLRAYERLDRHDGRRPFCVWLYRIAARIAVDHSRKSRPQPGWTPPHWPTPASPIPTG